MKPETKFRRSQVIPFLESLTNTFFMPIQQIALVGDPDFLLCANGFFVALELKKSKDDFPTALQKYKLDQVREAHGVALVASPDNWEQVKKILTDLDGGMKL